MAQKLIGVTGPSAFQSDIIKMTENFFSANFVLLYHENDASLDYWADKVDALILAGGTDIHPSAYMPFMQRECNLSKFDIRRDHREFKLIKKFLESKKPILGICRGHQLLGLYHNLKFIPDVTNSRVIHRPSQDNIQVGKDEPAHTVQLLGNWRDRIVNLSSEGNSLEKVFSIQDCFVNRDKNPENLFWINSFHHQGLVFEEGRFDLESLTPKEREDIVPYPVDILGRSPCYLKGSKFLIELMMSKDNSWISCQWHPEFDYEENRASMMVLETFRRML